MSYLEIPLIITSIVLIGELYHLKDMAFVVFFSVYNQRFEFRLTLLLLFNVTVISQQGGIETGWNKEAGIGIHAPPGPRTEKFCGAGAVRS